MASGPIPSWQIDRWGNNGNSDRLYIVGLQNHWRSWQQPCNWKTPCKFGRKGMTNLDSILKSRHYFANKGPSSQIYGFSSSHIWMWELDYKESWALKNWCFWTVVLEKTLESPLDCREIQPVNPKGNWSYTSLKGLMLKLKFEYFGHLVQRTESVEKTLMGRKIEGRRRRGWHHRLNGHVAAAAAKSLQ